VFALTAKEMEVKEVVNGVDAGGWGDTGFVP
jgi:hypothetical protein